MHDMMEMTLQNTLRFIAFDAAADAQMLMLVQVYAQVVQTTCAMNNNELAVMTVQNMMH